MSCDCNCNTVSTVNNSGFRRDGLYNKFDVVSTRTGDFVDTFTFTLIPDGDAYAHVALVAYANACSVEAPELASNIKEYLRTGNLPEAYDEVPE